MVKYNSDKPCKYGHLGERYLKNHACVTCFQVKREQHTNDAQLRRHGIHIKRYNIHQSQLEAMDEAFRLSNVCASGKKTLVSFAVDHIDAGYVRELVEALRESNDRGNNKRLVAYAIHPDDERTVRELVEALRVSRTLLA